jgi:hypothetical protein
MTYAQNARISCILEPSRFYAHGQTVDIDLHADY